MARALRFAAAAAVFLASANGARNTEDVEQAMEVDRDGGAVLLEEEQILSSHQATMNSFDSLLQFVRSAHDFEMTSASDATLDARLDAMVKEMTDSLREDLGLGPPGDDDAETVEEHIEAEAKASTKGKKGKQPKGSKQSKYEWLSEKMSELGKLGKADLALGVAAWRAKSKIKSTTKKFIKVGRVHMLHPVGSWRPTTWAKTLKRRDAVLAAKAEILANGGKLTQEMIATIPALKIMSSITPFQAATLEYCQWSYILLEGNGRMRGMQLAAQEDPELQDLEVEVDFFDYDDKKDNKRLAYIHKGLANLWSIYVKQASEMAPDSEDKIKQINEYYTFKFDLLECNGKSTGWFSENDPCEGKSVDGQDIRIPKSGLSSLYLATGKQVFGKYVTYQVCPKQQVAQIIMKDDEVEEYCDRCIEKEAPCHKP